MTEAASWRVAYRTVLFVFLLLFLVWLVVQLRSVVVQVLLAIILSAGMTPLVDRVTRAATEWRWGWKPPRAVIVLVLYLLLIGLITLLGTLTIPPLFREIESLAIQIPTYLQRLQIWLEPLVAAYPLLADFATPDGLTQQLQRFSSQLTSLLSQALVVVRFAFGLVSGAFNTIFLLVLALYMTSDSRRIVDYLVAFLPYDRQSQASQVSARIGARLGGWVRGQLLLSAIIGSLTWVGLTVLGLPYALLLALIAAIGEVIPMIGPIISAVPAVLIAFIYSPLQGFLTLGLYVIIQQLENHLIVPKVMERAVALHPLAVLLALLAGSELMGVTGAILSVPTAAAISVVVDEIRRQRLKQTDSAVGESS